MSNRLSVLVFAATFSLAISIPVLSHALQPSGGKKKHVTVTSDTMEANTAASRVVFRGNVTAVEDFTLCSNELSIIYDGNKDVSGIEATGDVRIYQDQKTSTAGRAVYDRRQRLIVLTGEPEVSQCSDVIRGDKITVYLDDNNAVVESGDGKRVKAVIMPDKSCPGQGLPERTGGEEALCNGAR